MVLTAGNRLGSYDVLAPLGAGGMGEVYRARDPKLQRDVAIKTLPLQFASDPERLARFEREAQALAALNHPSIAGIHELLEHDGARFLVLEYVSGELAAEELAHLEGHLRSCPPCVIYVETYRATITVTRRLRSAPLPAHVEARLRDAIRRECPGALDDAAG